MNEKKLFCFNQHFTGERLRHARKSWGYTQAELSKRTGLGAASISHWESGRRVPGLQNLFTLLVVLQVTADDVLGLWTLPAAVSKIEKKQSNNL